MELVFQFYELLSSCSSYLSRADFGWGVYIVVISVVVVLMLHWLRNRAGSAEVQIADGELETEENVSQETLQPKYRFRKRDKFLFYGRKLLRKIHLGGEPSSGTSTPVQTVGGVKRLRKKGRTKSRVLMTNLTKLFRKARPVSIARPIKRPPPVFLEETKGPFPDVPEGFNPEVFWLLRNIRVFGHIQAPFIWDICKNHIEEQHISKGAYLFEPGMPDDSIFVVMKGSLSVILKEGDREFVMKNVGEGESVYSLLSVVDVMTGDERPFKTAAAKALEDSTVIRLKVRGFREAFDQSPEMWVRAIQVIVIRLLHVTITTLHNYLGMRTELTKPSLREPLRKGRHYPAASASGFRTSEFLRRESAPVRIVSQKSFGSCTSDEESEAVAGSYDQGLEGFRIANSQKLAFCRQLSEEKRRTLHEVARRIVGENLGLQNQDLELLDGRFTVEAYPPGYHVLDQGDADSYLFCVLVGCLELLQKSVDGDSNVVDSLVYSQEMIGGMAVLTGEPSFFTVKARQFSRVAKISRNDFYEIMQERPRVVLNVAHSVVKRMSPFVRAIDYALDWEMCESGQALYNFSNPVTYFMDDHLSGFCVVAHPVPVSDALSPSSVWLVVRACFRAVPPFEKHRITHPAANQPVNVSVKHNYLGILGTYPWQGSPSEHLFVVLSGRLRSVLTLESGRKDLVDEFGRGDLVGMLEVFTQKPRATTVMAIRYSELAKLPEGLLNYIKMKHPPVLLRVIQLLGHCISGYHQKLAGPSVDSLPNIRNLHTIAVVGVNEDVPVTAFTLELWNALNSIKPALLLSSVAIQKALGTSTLESGANDFRLLHWLNMQEDAYSVVIYQCDSVMSVWSRRCVKQADCVLIVARGDAGPEKGPVEWYEQNVFNEPVDRFSDFSRLARLLTGNSIGLVLGGGGARGASHVGILEALKEVGIPIDIVAGVSIGAFIGALYCQEPENLKSVSSRAKSFFMRMTSTWTRLMDLTYPHAAIFTGTAFNDLLRDIYGERQLEDLWIPFFCISTDITSSEMRVHRTGEGWIYLRASMSYAGILPPMCDPKNGHLLVDGCYVNNLPGPLWAYCRASMSIAGYTPPLCDPVDGHLLLDGGYVNNLPDVMRSMGVRSVIAVDVGAPDERDMTNYGASLSGTWVLLNKWNPWGQNIKVPNMAEIQSRLAYVSCVRQMEQVKKASYCHYIRPPIDKYLTLEFKLYDQIKEVGYVHGKPLLESWACDGEKLLNVIYPRESIFGPAYNLPRPPSRLLQAGACRSSPSFTDLATLVTRMKNPAVEPSEDDQLSDLMEENDLSEDENMLWIGLEEEEDLQYVEEEDIIEQEDSEYQSSAGSGKTDEESLAEADRNQ